MHGLHDHTFLRIVACCQGARSIVANLGSSDSFSVVSYERLLGWRNKSLYHFGTGFCLILLKVSVQKSVHRGPVQTWVCAHRGGVVRTGYPQEALGTSGGLIELVHHVGGYKVILGTVDE